MMAPLMINKSHGITYIDYHWHTLLKRCLSMKGCKHGTHQYNKCDGPEWENGDMYNIHACICCMHTQDTYSTHSLESLATYLIKHNLKSSQSLAATANLFNCFAFALRYKRRSHRSNKQRVNTEWLNQKPLGEPCNVDMETLSALQSHYGWNASVQTWEQSKLQLTESFVQ